MGIYKSVRTYRHVCVCECLRALSVCVNVCIVKLEVLFFMTE